MSTNLNRNSWVATSSGFSADVFQIVRQAPNKVYMIQWRTRHCTELYVVYVCFINSIVFAFKNKNFDQKFIRIDFDYHQSVVNEVSQNITIWLKWDLETIQKYKAYKWTQNTISSSFCNKRKKKKKKCRKKTLFEQ